MRIGMGLDGYHTRMAAGNTNMRGGALAKTDSASARTAKENQAAVAGSLIWQMTEKENEKKSAQEKQMVSLGEEGSVEEPDDRSEAVKVYEEAFKGGPNPLENLRPAPKVPYGHLAKDGVIIYNGVVFTCDEKSNSICIGDVSDPKKVVNIALSGGGNLKVNRDNLGQLSKAIGMFSPEDVNLILRAIHKDTKLQSMQKEIEDLEAGVGEQIASGNDSADKAESDSETDDMAFDEMDPNEYERTDKE